MDNALDQDGSLQREALRLNGVGAWAFDLEHQTLIWSDEVYRLHELPRTPTPPTLAWALSYLVADSRAQFERALRRAISEGQSWDLELRLLTARGRMLSVRSRGQAQMQDGLCVRVVGLLEETVPRQPAPWQSSTSDPDLAKLAWIVQHTQDLLILTDTGDHIEWVNDRFVQVTGYTLAQAQGRTLRELLGQPLSSSHSPHPPERNPKPQHAGVELRLFKRNGTPYWAEVDVLPLTDAAGQVHQFLHVQRDVTTRHESEAQKAILIDRFEAVGAGAGMGYAQQDIESGITYWDARCFALHGLAQSVQAPSDSALEAMVLPEDQPAYRQLLETLRTGAPAQDRAVDGEYRIRKPDSTIAWLHQRAWCEFERGGSVDAFVQPMRVIAIYMDVTAHKQAEQQLRVAHERLELASHGSGIGLFEYSADTGTTYWNDECFKLFGLDPSPQPPTLEALGSVVHPDDRARFIEHWQALGASAQFRDMEFRVSRTTPGQPPQERWLLLRSRPVDAAPPAHRTVGVVMDVTELRTTQQTLQGARDRLTLATQASRIATWELDLNTGIVQWDALMFRFHGLPPGPSAPPMSTVVKLIHPDDVERFVLALQKAQNGHKSMEWEYRVIHPDGGMQHLLTRAQAQFAADNSAVRIVGATLDVSDSRRTSERLREALSRLRIATEAAGVGTFERDLITGAGRWDGAMMRLWGLPPNAEAPTFEQSLAMVVPEDRATVSQAMERTAGADHAVEFEYRIRRGDGQLAVLNTRGRAERDEHGNPVRIVGATVDVTASREAQVRLREFNEWMQLSSQATGVGFFRRGADGRTLFSDRQLRVHFGLNPDGPLPRADEFRRNVLPEDLPKVDAAHEQALHSDKPVELEYRVRDPQTDEIRYLFTRRVRIEATNERDASVVGAVIDVTASRAAQHALASASERLALATRTAGMGIWEWNVVTGQEVWDNRMREIYGISDPNWVPSLEGWRLLVHPDDRERALRPFTADLDCISSGESEYRIVRPQGEVRSVLGSYVVERDSEGRPVRMLGTDLDITEVRRADQERQQLSERISIAAAGARIGFWHFVVGSHAPYADDQTIALYGRTREDDPDFAAHWLDYVHPEDRARMRAAAGMLTHTDEPIETEFRIHLPNGQIRHLAVRAWRSIATDGRAVVNGVNWDVTEQRMAESTLRAKEMAERASAAKTEFLSRMSHELRTPLNAVLGFAQIMEIDARNPLNETQQGRLSHIQKAGWHLLTLINEILDLSRIEAGKTQLNMAAVPLGEVVDECLSLVSTEAERRHITLRSDISNAGPPTRVWADRVRLKQVLLNLLSNAVKYNRESGSVSVQVQASNESEIVISVRDTGPGLSEAQMAEIFEPFNRLGLDTASNEGTGIGLTISQKLTQQMGGMLTVASRQGEGSEFRIALKSANANAATQAETNDMPTTATRVRPEVLGSVLYVEDNPANIAVIEEALSMRPGVKFFTARDGATARVLAAVCQPDVVLLDIGLPDIDGLSLIDHLHAREATRQVPCIAVSGNAAPDDIATARNAGFVDFWAKPISVEQLLNGIDYWLSHQRLPTH